MEQPCQLNSFSQEYSAWTREGENYSCIFGLAIKEQTLAFSPQVSDYYTWVKKCLCTHWQTAAWDGVGEGSAFTTPTQLLSCYLNHQCSLVSWERIPAVARAKWMYAVIQVGSVADWVPSYANEAPKGAASTAGPESLTMF